MRPFKKIHVSEQNYSLTGENWGAIIFQNPKTLTEFEDFSWGEELSATTLAKKNVLSLENKFTHVKYIYV